MIPLLLLCFVAAASPNSKPKRALDQRTVHLLNELFPNALSNPCGPSALEGATTLLNRLATERSRFTSQVPLELAQQLTARHRDDLDTCGKMAKGELTVEIASRDGRLDLTAHWNEGETDPSLARCMLTRLEEWQFPQPLAAPVSFVFSFPRPLEQPCCGSARPTR